MIALGYLFAGIGLIFIGTQYMSEGLKEFAGARFSQLVGWAVAGRLRASLFGIAAGAVIQSTNAVSLIVTSLIAAGVTTVERAVPLITWSYVGSTLRVLIVVFDLKAFTLYLIGTIGVAFLLGLDRSANYSRIVRAVLGLALIFLGVQMISVGAKDLAVVPAVVELVAMSERHRFLGLVIGFGLALVIQGTTLTMIAITLAGGGLLHEEATIMIVIGGNVGSALQSYLQTANLDGSARQLSLFQFVMRLSAGIILLAALMFEELSGWPGLYWLVRRVSDSIAAEATFFHWAYQLVGALAMTLVHRPILRLLELLSPASVVEALGRPHFLYRQALVEPTTALRLVELEQSRTFKMLPDYLERVRADGQPDRVPPPRALHQAGRVLVKEIERFVTAVLARKPDGAALDHAVVLQNRAELIGGLHETMHDLTATLLKARGSEPLSALVHALAEASHVLLLMAVDALDSRDADDMALVATLATDRADMMARIRAQCLKAEPPLGAEQQQLLFAATNLFERVVWLLKRFSLAFAPAAETEPEDSPAAL